MSIKLTNKTVLITGASSGVGKACAEQFAEQGAQLILTARRLDRLESLARQLAEKYQVKVLPIKLDITNKSMINQMVQSLSDEWKTIDILVNNAGVGVTTELMQNANPDDWDTIIDTNVKGLLYMTRAILPIMVTRNSGHIINISSTSGHDYYQGGNVYSASKHAVKALTRCLRADLKGYNIRVSDIVPGMIQTEFSETRWGKERAEQFYAGFEPLVAEDIADSIIYCATRPSRVNISEVMVYPTAQVSPTVVHRANVSEDNALFD